METNRGDPRADPELLSNFGRSTIDKQKVAVAINNTAAKIPLPRLFLPARINLPRSSSHPSGDQGCRFAPPLAKVPSRLRRAPFAARRAARILARAERATRASPGNHLFSKTAPRKGC